MGQVNSDLYDDYSHNGEKIYVDWKLYAHKMNDYKTTYSERIQFTYKNIDVIEFYNREDTKWYNITKLMCNMIDKLGEEKFHQYKKYYDDYKTLEEDYIIVNNNVYKPYIDNSVNSGDLIYYRITIQMEDGKMLDGRTNFNQQGMNPFDKEEYNKDEQLNRLKDRVKEYFKEKQVTPKEQFLLKQKTEECKKIIKWFDENEILDYIIKL
ncbi:hypothetical protein G9F71_013615 [Clostridium sp. FP2]|uniref:hypothetical protein n=1 Tax=Clostridium TaxID=1485 RepID=UPI0013E9344F|nr:MULTISPECIES: hypothetical protein [Clostridium]MBW9157807.1 hypothetical protein [Clostridium tagluense]MBZ9623884.1 hypothetical protein [Clostridium sp. FP2]WLC63782.1 hypothetical protein KTC93_12900 [Clostridium tagluense]